MIMYAQYLQNLHDAHESEKERLIAEGEMEWLGENEPIKPDPILHPDLFDEYGNLIDEW